MKAKLLWLTLAAGVVAGWVVLAQVATFLAPLALIFGWAFFLLRVLPQMTVDWASVLVGATAILLFCAGIHWLGWTS